ncbi:AMIN domain-containing protein [Calothrix sp. UHCC 0171]|uniref:AMIN domain-containing protein n=1 Tax=Calothrix sp. UHCC 0171 TaxID=3110245 RepID=UPI002B1E9A0C|nr:AMIN domain-containing protein [Calothrix sp. UHCC 0171]MEA5571070.1 AMIN domain-containing protein [Calothrix sp. UHCC 0171]
MKQLHGNAFIFGATAAILVAQVGQPAWAQTTQITGVKLKQVDGKVNLVLDASAGDRAQVFTTRRGNALVADIINTQLRLPEGNSFRQDNPGPGIASVSINQLDSNSIRVVVTGSKGTPNTQPVIRGRDGLTLSFVEGDGTVAAAPPISSAPAVPNPPIAPPATISQQPAPAEGPGQPNNSAPPFLPRAVAPPVGDIAISALDASPSVIDLGTQERVPRLVLRDAPVREVLSLLARAANMNLAYSSVDATAQGGQPATATPGDGLKVSLDIQNEPVQDVFNYVLRLSGLEANRSGRTIFVGPRLPNSSRDVVMRNLRLNQVTVNVALNFLVGLGAESAVSRERQVTSISAIPVGQGANPITQSQTTTETKIERLSLEDSKYSSPLLRGLQALGDERTNSITLIGTPKQVELAMAQLSQLDIRRRQVAVNVKIVDVNLTGIKDFNTSFSFGIGNNFFSSDNGSFSSNLGGSRPPTSAEVQGSVTGTPIIPNPVVGENVFLGDGFFRQRDRNNPLDRPSANPSVSTNPLRTGITQFTPGTDGAPDTYVFNQPSLYQFPKRFLASVQAQVQNRNAKILTDPTLIVQEGQTANVNLTQEVPGKITETITDTPSGSRTTREVDKEKVGLTLNVKIDRIDDNGFVSLFVSPSVSAPVATQNTGAGIVTLISERTLNSGLVRLRDGQTLILSGIIQDSDRTSVSKLPILGDIPLIGSLFRRTNRENQRNEVIVLLTPQIIDDSERSSYGYNYNPSPEVRQMLERRGLQVPRK